MKYKLECLKTEQPYANGIGTYDYYESIPYRYLIWHTIYDQPPDMWIVLDMDDNQQEYRFAAKRDLQKFIRDRS